MATTFKAETHRQKDGAIVELGIVAHDGREHAALGSVIDHKRGIVVGYVKETANGFALAAWGGETIAPLDLIKTWFHRPFGGARVKMHAWRAKIDGRVYTGRNAGPAMVLRMRAKV